MGIVPRSSNVPATSAAPLLYGVTNARHVYAPLVAGFVSFRRWRSSSWIFIDPLDDGGRQNCALYAPSAVSEPLVASIRIGISGNTPASDAGVRSHTAWCVPGAHVLVV